MDSSDKLLGTLIRTARLDEGLTQEQLAEKLDCNLSYIGNIERHKNMPSLKLFCDIMRTLNISADDFVYPERHFANDTYQQLLRLINQCTEGEKNILLENARTLIKYRSEKPE